MEINLNTSVCSSDIVFVGIGVGDGAVISKGMKGIPFGITR